MRSLLLAVCTLAASAAAAQPNRLPRFEDYPAGPMYRGRVAPLVEASSPTARMFRTRTREAMAEGVNFAGHYVVAMWGCGTECMSGHIVDARTGRAVTDLPFGPYVTYHADSRLIAVMQPAEIIEAREWDAAKPIPVYYQSSYWVLDADSLRHLGSLLASDIEQIRQGRPAPPLRHATPGDVLVPLAVGNTWSYAGMLNGQLVTVTYRVTGLDPEEFYNGFFVERAVQGGDGTRRTIETWYPGSGVGDGSFGGGGGSYPYSFGIAEAGRDFSRTERTTVRLGTASREAMCYVTDAGTTEYGEVQQASRTCFVPRVGMVSSTKAGETLTLTSHTLR